MFKECCGEGVVIVVVVPSPQRVATGVKLPRGLEMALDAFLAGNIITEKLVRIIDSWSLGSITFKVAVGRGNAHCSTLTTARHADTAT